MENVKSLKAEKRWGQIPESGQQQILSSVYCVGCGKGQPVSEFLLTGEGGTVIIRGKYKVCGGEVARVIEEPDM